jgi:hypothetical protein
MGEGLLYDTGIILRVRVDFTQEIFHISVASWVHVEKCSGTQAKS